MNRRQILKSALLAPFLGMFKSRKSTGVTNTKPDWEDGVNSFTIGTSSEGPVIFVDELGRSYYYSYERNYEIKAHKVY